MNTSVCSTCGLQNTSIPEESAGFSEDMVNASSELHLMHSNSLSSDCKCNEHLKGNNATLSLKCLDRDACGSIKEESSDASVNDVELPVAVSTQRCSAVLNSLNVYEFSESPEEAATGHKQFSDVKECVEDKGQFHEQTPVRHFVDFKMAPVNIDDGLGTCTVPRKNTLTDEALDGQMLMSLPKKADKENSLQCNLKASLHHDPELNEHTAVSKQQSLSSPGRSKVANHLHHSSKDQLDHSKESWQSIRKTSNRHARVKTATVTKNLRNCKRASGVRINDFDNQCDVVYISQPITECQFENQRSIISPRKTARKSTRGYFFNGECCEISTVRTLFHGSKAGEIVNCSKLIKETLVFKKQSLPNNLPLMQLTALANPDIADFSVSPVNCVLQGSPFSEDKMYVSSVADDPQLEFETCDSRLLAPRNPSPFPLATLCSQVNSENAKENTSVTFQCSSVPCSVKEDYTKLVNSVAITTEKNRCTESLNEKAHQESNIETVPNVIEKDSVDSNAVSNDEINCDLCPSNPSSVDNSECPEISCSISFVDVPSCELNSDPYTCNTNSVDNSECQEISSSVPILDVPPCEIHSDLCFSNLNSVDNSECPEISSSVSFLDVPSCAIISDPCPSNSNSVDNSECPEISESVPSLDIPPCEIHTDLYSSNPISVDNSVCPEISRSVSFLDVPSSEINSDLCPSHSNSVDNSECPEISEHVPSLDVPPCEIHTDLYSSNPISVDNSVCPEISRSVSFLDVSSSEINSDLCPSHSNSVDNSECPEISESVPSLDVPSCEVHTDLFSSNPVSVDNSVCPEISRYVPPLDVSPCNELSDHGTALVSLNSLDKEQNCFPKFNSDFEKSDFVQSAEFQLIGNPADANKAETVDRVPEFSAKSLFYEHTVDARLSMCLAEECEDLVDSQSAFSEGSYDEESIDFKLDLTLEETPGKDPVGSRDEVAAQDGHMEYNVEVRRSLYSEETHETICNRTISPLEKMADCKIALPSDMSENMFCSDLSFGVTNGKEMLDYSETASLSDSFDKAISESLHASPTVSVKKTFDSRPTSPFLISDNASLDRTCLSLSIDAFGENAIDSNSKSPSEIPMERTVCSIPTSPSFSEETATISVGCVSPFNVVKPYESDSVPASPIKTAIQKETKSPKLCNTSKKSCESTSISNETEKALASDQDKQNEQLLNKPKIQKGIHLEMSKAKTKEACKKKFVSASSTNEIEKQLTSDQGKKSKKLSKPKNQKSMNLEMGKAKRKQDDDKKSFETEKQLASDQGKGSKKLSKKLSKPNNQSMNLEISKTKGKRDDCKRSFGNASNKSNETKKQLASDQGKESKTLNKPKISKSVNLAMSKNRSKEDDCKKSLVSASSSNETEKQPASNQGKESKKLLNKPKIPKSVNLVMSKDKSKEEDCKKPLVSASSSTETEKQLASNQGKESKKLLYKPKIPKSVNLAMSKDKSKEDDCKKLLVSASSSNVTEKQLASNQGKESKKLLNKPKIPKSVNLEMSKGKSKEDHCKTSLVSASSGKEAEKQLASDQGKESKKMLKKAKIHEDMNLEMKKAKSKQDDPKNSVVSASSSNETEKQLVSDQCKESKKLLNKLKIQKSLNLKMREAKSKHDGKQSCVSASSDNETEKQQASIQGKENKKLSKPKINKSLNLEPSKAKSKQDDSKQSFESGSRNNEREKEQASDKGKKNKKLSKPKIQKRKNLERSKAKSKQDDSKQSLASASTSNETKHHVSAQGKESKKLSKPKIIKCVNLEMSKAKSKQDDSKQSLASASSSNETKKQHVSDQGKESKKFSKPKIEKHVNLEMSKAKSKQDDSKLSFASANSSNETEKQHASDQGKESKKCIKPRIQKSMNLEMSKAKSKQNPHKKSDVFKKSSVHKNMFKNRKKKKRGKKVLLKSDRCLRSQHLHLTADSSMELASTSSFQVPSLKIKLLKSPGAKRFQRMVHIHRAIHVHFSVNCFNWKLLHKMQDVNTEEFENSDDEFPVVGLPTTGNMQAEMIAYEDTDCSVSESIFTCSNINQAEALQILVDMNSNERKVHLPKHDDVGCTENIEHKPSNDTTQNLKSGKVGPIICKYEKNDSSTSSQTFLTTRSGKKPMLSQTFMKRKKRILRNHKLRLASTLERRTKINLLKEGSLISMEERHAHSTKEENISSVNPLNVNTDLTGNNKEKCRKWFSEEEKQTRVADFNAKYLNVQKRWILLEKEIQSVHKVKNKSDKLKEIWRTKKRVRKVRHSSEVTKLSPVQVLFMKTFKLSDICKWFLETTETKSLVIVKKVNTRLPGDFPLPALPIPRYPSSIVYPPSAQAERLKKHLKKFASASPIKNNSKTQKMFAQYQDTFDSDSDKSDILSTNTDFDVINDVANGRSSQSLETPESVRILRKYSSMREKLKAQHCQLESEKKDMEELKEDEHCPGQKGVCVNPVISSNLMLQVQPGESCDKAEGIHEDKRGKKRPHKFTNSEAKPDKKKKLQDNISSTEELSSSSPEPIVRQTRNKVEQNNFLKIVPATRKQTSLVCMSKESQKPSLKEKKAKMSNKLVQKGSQLFLKGNIKKSKRKMANIELLLRSTKIKVTKKHFCKSQVKDQKEPYIAKTQTRSMKRAEFQKIIKQNTIPGQAAHTKRRHPVTK